MIKINLLPKEEREKGGFRENPGAGSIFSSSFLAVSLFVVLSGTVLQIEKGKGLEEARSQLEENIELRKKSSGEVLANEKEAKRFKDYFSKLERLDKGRETPVLILEELSKNLPQDLWYTSVFQSGPAEITIEGVSLSNLRVAHLMNGIEMSPVFEDVRLVFSEKGTLSGEDVVKFKLSARVLG